MWEKIQNIISIIKEKGREIICILLIGILTLLFMIFIIKNYTFSNANIVGHLILPIKSKIENLNLNNNLIILLISIIFVFLGPCLKKGNTLSYYGGILILIISVILNKYLPNDKTVYLYILSFIIILLVIIFIEKYFLNKKDSNLNNRLKKENPIIDFLITTYLSNIAGFFIVGSLILYDIIDISTDELGNILKIIMVILVLLELYTIGYLLYIVYPETTDSSDKKNLNLVNQKTKE